MHKNSNIKLNISTINQKYDMALEIKYRLF